MSNESKPTASEVAQGREAVERILGKPLPGSVGAVMASKASGPRPLRVIAAEIRRTWPKPYFGAVPYLSAMADLESINDKYGLDDAKEIVIYFLANAQTWKGDDARRIKAELKKMAGIK